MVQTTGDILTDAIVDDLLARGVWMISVASVDDFHVGLEGPEKQQAFIDEAFRDVRAARNEAVGPVAHHAQLARGGGAGLQLFRRDAGFVDRQAVAARAGVAEQPLSRPRWPTTSATAGRAASISCATNTTARKCRWSPTARSIRAA